ncbi:MAG: 3-hydroxyacyl-ACP dehydratase [Flavipsychrobacter sp.]|nr:3-hydroxyacyl-ACP dehydratase [Flavipsychrobacter sp.]
MLKDDLYTIQELIISGNSINTTIVLNADHKIFDGHFPGHPVLPGVCTMQMVREILETVLLKPLKLSRGGNIKFISLIVPAITPLVHISLSYKIVEDKISTTASATVNNLVCFKFQGVYAADELAY